MKLILSVISCVVFIQFVPLESAQKELPEVFNQIAQTNFWGSTESVSGPGSTLDQTIEVRKHLPGILNQLGVLSILDMPCGDFNWMRTLDLTSYQYIGMDIVHHIISDNITKYAQEYIAFRVGDLTKDTLPVVDFIFCRDCLVHLSYENIKKALKNMLNSGARYLCTTSFWSRKSNHDIVNGSWRPLNLEAAPFSFPKPLCIIDEKCPASNGKYFDKSLAVWALQDLEEIIGNL